MPNNAPYGNLQNPVTNYRNVQNPPNLYLAQAPSSGQPILNPTPETNEAKANRIRDELILLYRKVYLSSRGNVGLSGRRSLGSVFASKIKLKVIPASNWATELSRNRERSNDFMIKQYLNFNPQEIQDKLIRYYKAINEDFIKVYGGQLPFNKATKLKSEDIKVLFGRYNLSTIDEDEAINVAGFYSISERIIYLNEDSIDYGVIAHELAHAYSDGAWRDFVTAMIVFGKKNSVAVNEGLTSYFAKEVINKWILAQPTDTIIPDSGALGYLGKLEFKFAQKFLDDLTIKIALEVYFLGSISDFRYDTDGKLINKFSFGDKSRKEWSWPW